MEQLNRKKNRNNKQTYQITSFVHRFVKDRVCEGDICIDATAGNGNDTLFLRELVGEEGKVLAFDIQKIALEHTQQRLECNGYAAEFKQIQLICDSHANMASYADAESISCIMFNFGYLPGGDHAIQTKAESSLAAIQAGLDLLKIGGIMTLCIYSGQDSGFEEKDAILSYLKELDNKKYLVIASFYYNRRNNPPIPVVIEKL